MPKKTQPRSKSSQFVPIDFVDLRLNSGDREAFQAWMTNTYEFLLEALASLVGDGWKMSLSWDEGNVCFISSFTCKSEDSVNENVCITSRSNDAFEAICLGVYKLTVLYPDADLRKIGTSSSWG